MGLLNSKNTYFPEHLAMAASDRSSNQELFLGKGVLKISSKFTGEHPLHIEIEVRFQY